MQIFKSYLIDKEFSAFCRFCEVLFYRQRNLRFWNIILLSINLQYFLIFKYYFIDNEFLAFFEILFYCQRMFGIFRFWEIILLWKNFQIREIILSINFQHFQILYCQRLFQLFHVLKYYSITEKFPPFSDLGKLFYCQRFCNIFKFENIILFSKIFLSAFWNFEKLFCYQRIFSKLYFSRHFHARAIYDYG